MLTLREFLHSEVKPALGCTEPGAVALAVARAFEELERAGISGPDSVSSVRVMISDSVYKNGMAVGVPGAGGAKGNGMAAALAVFCGRSEYGLEVLKECEPAQVEAAEEWVRQQRIQIVRMPDKSGVYVEAHVTAGGHEADCVIDGHHSNIVHVSCDGSTVFQAESSDPAEATGPSVMDRVNAMSYEDLRRLSDEMNDEDMQYLLEGVSMNKAIAEYGLEQDSLSGLSLGKAMKNLMAQKLICEDLGYLVKSYCYAASDARMAGAQLPVMSSAGSGNHGITAVLPIALVGERLGKTSFEIARALAISHLATSFVKSRIGRLSPVCGCAVAAGAGAAAGLVNLMGGSAEQEMLAMRTVLADTAGMICDGAKESCTLKVGTGAGEAYLSALFALEGRGIDSAQGVVESSIEQTTDNVGRLNREGMERVDRVMIDILDARNHRE